MVDRKGKGFRRKTRDKLSKHPRQRGKLTITRILQKFNNNDKVAIVIEPSWHYGMPHPRYHGLVGTVVGKRGNCYEVELEFNGEKKLLIVHPAHLKKVG
uniref:Large ribosomal subunit protein eL21 n=1 Tax=Nanoarchaeum equitans (strain Kin4-M) TaxID=228908 RepID=RL21_NANEQ|nr:RecName: Full=Large ribosomal subunit protein eL21; AltName: Full=50S ribosomal protein L21e [Nanoarchaeum equitans Kin4-M]